MESVVVFLLVLLCDVEGKMTSEFVTYGSSMKLMNADFEVRLHSHDIKYGAGSKQQSVTGIESMEDSNSLWVVLRPFRIHGKTVRGEVVRCGDVIVLKHLNTEKFLHSHRIESPLTRQQEVSAFQATSNSGDSGDEWMLVCNGDYWERSVRVKLRHVDTDAYLSISGSKFGHPIDGQMEVVTSNEYSASPLWTVKEGIFFESKPQNWDRYRSSFQRHSEL